jgi:hypothetical protein
MLLQYIHVGNIFESLRRKNRKSSSECTNNISLNVLSLKVLILSFEFIFKIVLESVVVTGTVRMTISMKNEKIHEKF